MTKTVRIENADSSSYGVTVETWDKGQDGKPDTLVSSAELKNPANLWETYITSTRYLVVKETPPKPAAA